MIPDQSTLPHSDDAEAAVLGGTLLDNHQFAAVAGIIAARDFFNERGARVFRAIADLIVGESPADLVTLPDALKTAGSPDVGGDVAWVASIMDGTARSSNVAHYARIIADKAQRRRIISETARLQHVAWNGSTADEFAKARAEHLRIIGELGDLGAAQPASSPRALESFEAEDTEYAIRDVFRLTGTAEIYGPGGSGKTYILLAAATEMLAAKVGDAHERPPLLFDAEGLPIRRPWRRVVWVAGEETGPALRGRWDRVCAGRNLKPGDLAGTLSYLWAFDAGRRFTIDRTEDVLDAVGDHVDVLILDSWTSLVPPKLDGVPIEWDRDNYATRALFSILRDVAERRKLLILVVHHAGHDASHPRGPSEHRNSVDTMLRLEKRPERRVRVNVEKQRDGRDDWSIPLALEFTREAVRVRYEERKARTLTGAQQAVHAALAMTGRASVTEIAKATEMAPTTVRRALEALEAAGLASDSGDRAAKGSPVWQATQPTQTDADDGASGERA